MHFEYLFIRVLSVKHSEIKLTEANESEDMEQKSVIIFQILLDVSANTSIFFKSEREFISYKIELL